MQNLDNNVEEPPRKKKKSIKVEKINYALCVNSVEVVTVLDYLEQL